MQFNFYTFKSFLLSLLVAMVRESLDILPGQGEAPRCFNCGSVHVPPAGPHQAPDCILQPVYDSAMQLVKDLYIPEYGYTQISPARRLNFEASECPRTGAFVDNDELTRVGNVRSCVFSRGTYCYCGMPDLLRRNTDGTWEFMEQVFHASPEGEPIVVQVEDILFASQDISEMTVEQHVVATDLYDRSLEELYQGMGSLLGGMPGMSEPEMESLLECTLVVDDGVQRWRLNGCTDGERIVNELEGRRKRHADGTEKACASHCFIRCQDPSANLVRAGPQWYKLHSQVCGVRSSELISFAAKCNDGVGCARAMPKRGVREVRKQSANTVMRSVFATLNLRNDAEGRMIGLKKGESAPTVVDEAFQSYVEHGVWSDKESTICEMDTAARKLFDSWIQCNNVTTLTLVREAMDSGHLHLHCKFSLRKSRRFMALKKLLPKWDIEPAIMDDNLYLLKAESVLLIVHDGKRAGQRSDLDAVVDLVEAGQQALDLYDACPKAMIRYGTGIMGYIGSRMRKLQRGPVTVHWYHGVSGSGKTYTAATEAAAKYGSDIYYLAPDHGTKCWWDGYSGERAVVIDEFRTEHMGYADLLRLCDSNGLPLRLPSKGSSVWGNRIKEVWITSFQEPMVIFAEWDFQLERRIDEMREFTERYIAEEPQASQPEMEVEEVTIVGE